MKLIEIKELSTGELSEELKKARQELVDLRMKFFSRQLDNPSLIKKKRKDIARILTVRTQKSISGEEKKSKVEKAKKKTGKKEGK